MFKNLKQKIAEGVEGVSPGRQTPLQQQQQQTNRQIRNSSGSTTPRLKNNNGRTPTTTSHSSSSFSISSDTESEKPKASPMRTPEKTSTPSRRSSTFSNAEERSDIESDVETPRKLEQLGIVELREKYLKQEQTLKRFRQKFSEVVDAYKSIQKEKEKLETTLTSGQDKQLRRIKELKETMELEQEGKRHLEEVLRLQLDEKDDQLHVLQTQVKLLKTQFGVSSPVAETSTSLDSTSQDDQDDSSKRENQEKINVLNTEIDQLQKSNQRLEESLVEEGQIHKAELESMNTLHTDLQNKIDGLQQDLEMHEITILNLTEEKENLDMTIQNYQNDQGSNAEMIAAMEQEKENMKLIYAEKEASIKDTFANKVQELQRILEENEKQKAMTNQSAVTSEREITILKDTIRKIENKHSNKAISYEATISDLEENAKNYIAQLNVLKLKNEELNLKNTQQNEDVSATVEMLKTVQQDKNRLEKQLEDQILSETNQLKEKEERMQSALGEQKLILDQISTKGKEVEDMTNTLIATKKALDDAQAEIAKLTVDLKALEEEKCAVESTFESSKNDISKKMEILKKANADLLNRNNTLTAELQTVEVLHKNKLAELETAKTTTIDELTKQYEDQLKTKEEQFREKISVAMNEKDSSVNSLTTQLEEMRKKELEELESRHAAFLEETKNMYHKQQQELLQEHEKALLNKEDAMRLVREESARNIQALDEKFRELENQKKELQNKLVKIKEDFKKRFNKLKEMHKEELESLRTTTETDRQEFEENHKKTLTEKEDLITELKEQYAVDLQNLKESHKKELDGKEETLSQIKEQQNNSFGEISTKHAEDKQILMNEIENANANLEKMKAFIEKNNVEWKGRVAEEKKQLDLKTSMCEELESKLSGNSTQNEEVNSKLKQKSEECVQLTEKIAEQSARYEEERNRLEKKTLEFKDLEERFSEKVTLFEEEKAHLQEKCGTIGEELEGKVQELQSLGDRQSQLAQDHQSKVQSKDEEIASLKENLDAASDRNQEFDRENSEQKSMIEKLQMQTLSYEGNRKDLDDSVNNMMQEKHELEKIMKEKEIEYQNQIESLQEKIDSISKANEEETTAKESQHQNLMENKEKELLTKIKEVEDEARNKLLEMKKKAEAKIGKIKKDYNDRNTQQQAKIEELSQSIKSLNGDVKRKNAEIDELNKRLESVLQSSNQKESVRKAMDEKVEVMKEEVLLKSEQNTEQESKIKDLSQTIESLNGDVKRKDTEIDEMKKRLESFLQSSDQTENARKAMDEKVEVMKEELLLKSKQTTEQESKIKELSCSIDSLRGDIDVKDKRIADLAQNIEQLKSDLKLKEQSFENEVSGLKEKMEESVQLSSNEKECAEKTLQTELKTLKQELLTKTQNIVELEERLENAVVDKMDTLKTQKEHLDDEYKMELKKNLEGKEKYIETLEKKTNAKFEEKDFDYSSKVKVMMKEFQNQLANKEKELQDAVQDAMEMAQKDERRLVNEYEEQINELKKELRLREKDMMQYREENENNIQELQDHVNVVEEEHNNKVTALEQDYLQRLNDLVKRQESEIQQAAQKDVSVEESEMKMRDEMDARVKAMTEQHQTEMQVQEKKFKLQLKKNKEEMRKLLAEQGNGIANNDDDNNDTDVYQTPKKPNVTSNAFMNSPVSTPQSSQQPTIELEYLRNILFNFMMGKQRIQMAKVLTAMVHFPPSQVSQIITKVEEQEAKTTAVVGGYFSSYMKR